MDNLISQMLKQYYKVNEEYIISALKKYHIYTGNKDVYEMLIEKYGPDIAISYSEYLSQDNNLYFFDPASLDEAFKPISIVYTEPEFTYDPMSFTTKGYCRVELIAGNKKL